MSKSLGHWSLITTKQTEYNDLQDEGGGEGDQAGYDLSVLRFESFTFIFIQAFDSDLYW